MFSVYKITNKINNKIYIGYTKRTPKRRFQDHVYSSKNQPEKSPKFHYAIRKYRKDNFNIETIIQVETIEEAWKQEIFFIKQFDSYKNGYNMNEGGIGGNGKKLKGRVYTPEERKKLYHYGENHPMWRKIVSEETRQKIKEGVKGKYKPRIIPEESKYYFKEEWYKDKISKTHAKHWQFKKNGEIINIYNLSKYCKENNLHQGNFTSLKNGKIKQYKGYTLS